MGMSQRSLVLRTVTFEGERMSERGTPEDKLRAFAREILNRSFGQHSVCTWIALILIWWLRATTPQEASNERIHIN